MSVNFIDVQLINGILAHINVAQKQMKLRAPRRASGSRVILTLFM